MLLILFGTQDRRKVVGDGQFICPGCGVEKGYEVISIKEWLTLGFIPILPTANNEGREEFVECKTCKKAYDTDVLVKLTDNR